MKKLTLGAFLSLCFFMTLSKSTNVENEDEFLMLQEQKLSARKFAQALVLMQHNGQDPQNVLKNPNFLNEFIKLQTTQNQFPFIALMSEETRNYLRAERFKILSFQNALRLTEILGSYDTNQYRENFQKIKDLARESETERQQETAHKSIKKSLKTLKEKWETTSEYATVRQDEEAANQAGQIFQTMLLGNMSLQTEEQQDLEQILALLENLRDEIKKQ